MWKCVFSYKNYIYLYNSKTNVLILTTQVYPSIYNKIFTNIDITKCDESFYINTVNQLITDSRNAYKQYESYSREFKKPGSENPKRRIL